MPEPEPAGAAGGALRRVAEEHPWPLVFATISGAHLYGFASADSDWDLRGVHVLPLDQLVGLDVGPETHQVAEDREGLELDLVTHEVAKFCRLLLRPNGYVLEQLYSPLVVLGGDSHEELKGLAAGCMTSAHVRHYLGFADNQWRLFAKDRRSVKALLYVFRVLKTGIHLMRTGVVVADLQVLDQEPPVLPYLQELIARKQALGERSELDATTQQLERWQADVGRLRDDLRRAAEASHLPETPTARAALHDYVVRLRLG